MTTNNAIETKAHITDRKQVQYKEVAIILPPYLKQFFIYKYGREPVKLRESSKLYAIIIRYLGHIPGGWQIPESSDNILRIKLPYNPLINKSNLGYFSKNSTREIKNWLFGIFYGQLITYLHDKVICEKWSLKYAIINFCDKYDMTWNAKTYETLRKIFERYRNPDRIKKHRQRKKSQISVP
jgi:hypothetical protein